MRNRALLAILVGACVTAAGPASVARAHDPGAPGSASPPQVVLPAKDCGPGAPQAQFAHTMSGGVATVTVVKAGCTVERVLRVSSYSLDQSAANTSTAFGRSNPTSYPQSLHAHGPDIVITAGSVTKKDRWTSMVALPRCGDYQEDLYEGAVQDRVDANGHPGFRAGGIVLQPECTPAPSTTPTTPAAPTHPATTPATPATPTHPSTTSTHPSTTPTHPSTTPTHSSTPAPSATTTAFTTSPTTPATTRTSTPAATTTTAAPVSPAPSAPTTTAAPAAVLVAAPPAAPVRASAVPLAHTGSGDAALLVAVAAGLLVLGAGAVTATRRSRPSRGR